MSVVHFGVFFDAFRTEVLVAGDVGAEVCDGLLFVQVARHVVLEVRLHVVDVEGSRHERGCGLVKHGLLLGG